MAGAFYPAGKEELAVMIDKFIDNASPQPVEGDIFAVISPHAGYEFSGQTAAYGYKLLRGKDYKTVIVIGPSHHYPFKGVSIYPSGSFRTPLGDLEVDAAFAARLYGEDSEIFNGTKVFENEHSVEVQLPFLAQVLSGFKIVPVIMGDCSLSTCERFADLLVSAIGDRKDVLIVASSDMYHGYDYDVCERIDDQTLACLKEMDYEKLYAGLRSGAFQLCGGFPVVTAIIAAKKEGHNVLKELTHTNSAIVTGRREKGVWTVGYTSCIIDQEKKEVGVMMLDKNERKKLLEIARSSIESYLKSGRKLEVTETDPALTMNMGAFVTLRENGQLRGCIGNMVGQQPLYLTVRDMAVEAAVRDPRFPPVKPSELKNIEIEISALSPLKKVNSSDEITLGVHGVIVKKGFNTGVFLPQVADETGWSKEEFLSYLCSHKAGLPPDAWKDPDTELYVFTAEVFSESKY